MIKMKCTVTSVDALSVYDEGEGLCVDIMDAERCPIGPAQVAISPTDARRLRDWLNEWLDLHDTHPAALDAATVAD